MKTLTRLTTILVTIGLAAAPSWAQDDDLFDETDTSSPATDDGAEGGEAADATPSDDPTGTEENPDSPDSAFDDDTPGNPDQQDAEASAKDEAPKLDSKTYPQRLVDRPIILYPGMAEARLELPMTFDQPLFGVAAALRARFAATDSVEIGIRWAAIEFHEDIPGIVDDNNYTAGRAIQLDLVYQIFPWLGAQASVPFYLDPFAIGLTFGVPIQFTFGPLQFIAGRDLVEVNVKKFFPFWDQPVVNEIQKSIDEVNGVQSDGRINALFGIRYQHSDAFSITGETGYVLENFENKDNAVPMWLTGWYSPSNSLDVAVRIGPSAADLFTETFGVRLLAGLRI